MLASHKPIAFQLLSLAISVVTGFKAMGTTSSSRHHTSQSGLSAGVSAAMQKVRPAIRPEDARMVSGCMHWFTDYVPAWKNLIQPASRGSTPKIRPVVQRLATLTPAVCQDPAQIVTAMRQLQDSMQIGKQARVLVLLPLTGLAAEAGQAVKAGIESSLRLNGSSESHVIFADTAGDAGRLWEQMRMHLLTNEIRLMVGGISTGEAQLLANWSKKLRMPTLIINGSEHVDLSHHFAFRVFPDIDHLADSLAKAARSEGYRRIAILRPARESAARLASAFTSKMPKHELTLVRDVTYLPGQYPALEEAARQLLQLLPSQRQEEYKALVERRQAEAVARQERFDPSQVALQPATDFDAIFLPDDFRAVRHVLKLLRFLGVKRVRFIGSQEWRGRSLVEPFDDALAGSLFADYVGLYDQLPPSVSHPAAGSSFLDPSMARAVDFRLMGHIAGGVAVQALTQRAMTRMQLTRQIGQAQFPGQLGTFQRGEVFSAGRDTNWPAFVFRVLPDNISLLHSY